MVSVVANGFDIELFGKARSDDEEDGHALVGGGHVAIELLDAVLEVEKAGDVLRPVVPHQIVGLEAQQAIRVIGAGLLQRRMPERGLEKELGGVLELEFHLPVLLDQVLGAKELTVARGQLDVEVVPAGAFVDVWLETRAQGGEVGEDALDALLNRPGERDLEVATPIG